MIAVNDVHSRLNPTSVDRVARPTSIDELATTIRASRAVSIAGGRHAMGGQQFGAGCVLVDMRGLDRVLGFDRERGLVDVEAGIAWPELLAFLDAAQAGVPDPWGIVQKQTGADRLTLGGALAANVHGRGLVFKPIVGDVESFTIMDHTGEIVRCSRTENAELFGLAIGGYGLFGTVISIRLRLWRKRKVRRIVEIAEIDDLSGLFESRVAEGFLYGDFQYATDPARDTFLRRGVFSCYQPVAPETPLTGDPAGFCPQDWARLIRDAHASKGRAFDFYSSRYLETSGQVYWSDDQLSAEYLDDYHEQLDRETNAAVRGSEMITEIYVPRPALAEFMAVARRELSAREADVIYGTIRLIERDDETFLAWAREPFVCVIFNLHVDHTPASIDVAADAFRALIDLGIRFGGSFYLTYHRYATRRQIESCYPQFREFLRLKLAYDPEERFQSEWYRHHKALFAG